MTDNAQAWTVYNSLMVDPLTHTVYSAGEEVHLPEMECWIANAVNKYHL